MNDSSDPQVWLRLAEEEFNYALRDLKDEHLDFFAPTCFHFQQAAEKYLKAYILARGKTFRKIHNLVELVKTCVSEDLSFEILIKEAAFLNPFYTDTRYPAHWPAGFTRSDAEKAKDSAQKIGEFVKERIGKT